MTDAEQVAHEFKLRQLHHAEQVVNKLQEELGIGPTQIEIKADPQEFVDRVVRVWAADQPEGEQFEELLTWWRSISESDAQRTVPKAIEYGSIDLNIIGFALGECIPALKEKRHEGSTHAAEMGIAFYLLGKIARMVSAYSEGQEASDDTWMDVTVYSMMGRRVRDRGAWG